VRGLWDKHQDAMSEDYRHAKLSTHAVQQMVLIDIRNLLQSMGKDITSFPLPKINKADDLSEGVSRDIYEESIINVDPKHEALYTFLNAEQRATWWIVVEEAYSLLMVLEVQARLFYTRRYLPLKGVTCHG
jgi:ATP-dependent DNA helicase PIF1